jgi:hypothetical protein
MASADMVNLLLSFVGDTMTYMIPIIAVLAGLNFIITWFMSVVFGLGRQSFKGL